MKEIQAKLYQDATLKTRDISVIANDGVIVLIGQVSSEDERASAERLTGAVQGVRQVINQLVVVEASPPPPAPVQHSPAPGRSKRPVAGAPPT